MYFYDLGSDYCFYHRGVCYTGQYFYSLRLLYPIMRMSSYLICIKDEKPVWIKNRTYEVERDLDADEEQQFCLQILRSQEVRT